MATHYPVPRPDAVQEILGDLLGRTVKVTPAEPLVLERDTPAVVADYHSDAGPLAVVCITDLRLSNMLGAALTMVPASTVEDAVKKWQIEETNLENLAEVVNIMARLFNSDDTPHLRWKAVNKLPGSLESTLSELVKSPLGRRDYEVEIDEYGTGRMAIAAA